MKNFRGVFILTACSALFCSIGCGGGGSKSSSNTGGGSSSTQTIATSGANVTAITVDPGPATSYGLTYVNGAFASVTVCVPGSSTCQTIGGLLVDTGSVGLRVVSTVLSLSLPQQKSASGNTVAECLQFLDSYTWGPVETADIQISGEKAGSVPVQVLSDSDFTVPSNCTKGLPSADTVQDLGANGILGVGQFAQDCGSVCPASANIYYECPSSSGCTAITETAAQQVQNPVALFATDNNGVIVELPPASSPEATLSGSLVFGIGTQSNNALGSATIYTADPSTGDFTTTFNGQSYSGSFLDSGSNGYFFPDSSVPQCSSNSGASGFYCPTSTQSLSATNQGANGASGMVSFSVANAVNLFSTGDAVLGDLGGPVVSSGSGNSTTSFDWGLPFFYGRNVYTAIETATAAPYWAY